MPATPDRPASQEPLDLAAGHGRDRRLRRTALALAVLATLVALLAVDHRARKGRNALLKWAWALEAVERGEPVYGVGPAAPGPSAEGYPTLPVTLVLLRPFHALGPRLGPAAWAALSAALAWCVVLAALRLAPRAGPRAGPSAGPPATGAVALTVLALSGRVLYSELQHGNLDLVVAAPFALALVAFAARRDGLAGALFGAAAVVKVTPALALVWLVAGRSGRGLVGFALGVLVCAVLVPGLAFGFDTNLALARGWWAQMAAPYLAGRELTLLQTEHINQSLLGVLARLLTDAVAIEARPPVHPADVRIGWVHLSHGALHAVHRALALAVVVVVWRRAPRPVPSASRVRDGRDVLGSASLLALAMLFLSERSWKHHHVLLPLPIAYLAWGALRGGSRAAAAALAVALAAFVLSGEGVLGERGADLAEAYGAFLVGGLALFAACAHGLARERRGAGS